MKRMDQEEWVGLIEKNVKCCACCKPLKNSKNLHRTWAKETHLLVGVRNSPTLTSLLFNIKLFIYKSFLYKKPI